MQSRPSPRGATRALGALLVPVLLGVLALPALAQLAPVGADPDDRPGIWESRAAAAGLLVSVNTEPGIIPLADFIRFDVPEGDARWDSSGLSEARASSVYPGAAVTGGPGLMCMEFFPCPEGFPPDYPLSAVATYPMKPEAETQDGLARARAGRDEIRTDAALTDFAGLDALAPLFVVGGVEARTWQRFEEGVLVATSLSRVSGLQLLDGLVHIEQVEASSTLRFDGEGVQEVETRVTVSGVTVADQPAEITSDGISVVGQGDDGRLVQEAQAALDEALAEHAAEITLVGARETVEDTSITSRALGLSVSMRVPVEGEPLPNPFPPQFPLAPGSVYRDYLVDLTVARAVTTARIDAFDLGDLGDLAGLVGDPGQPPAPGFDGTVPGFEPATGMAEPFEPSAAPGAVGEAPSAAGPGGAETRFELLGGDAAEAVVRLYLGLALAAAALLAASRIGSAPRFIRGG